MKTYSKSDSISKCFVLTMGVSAVQNVVKHKPGHPNQEHMKKPEPSTTSKRATETIVAVAVVLV